MPKTSMAQKFFEKVFNLSKTNIPEIHRIWVIWPLKKKRLKTPFYVRQTHTKNVHSRKNSGKGVVLKRWFLIFSETDILENNGIWVIWVIKKEALHCCSWKYLFT